MCTDTSIDRISILQMAHVNDHTADVIYFDFGKAVDSVSIRFPLAKMKPFGLGDVWRIGAYLTGWV